jgi:hypothetical protein
MPPSGNFGSVTLDGDQLNASGTSIEIDGCEDASLLVAIVQDGNVARGLARTSPGTWVANGLSAEGVGPGDALGLACQTLVTVSDGTLPSFVTFTWSEQVTIS